MSDVNIEELFVTASETSSKNDINALSAALRELNDLKGEDVENGFELLFDAWADSVSDVPEQRNFIISIAELNPPTSSAFRNILADAIKASLPPYLRKPTYIKNLGLRDVDVHYKEVVTRFKALTQLKVGVYIYQIDTNIWGMVSAVDEFAGSVTVSNITGRNSLSIPLTTVLSKSKIFKSTPNVQKLVRPFRKNVPKCKDYFRSLDNFALTYLSDKVKRTIANTTLVPTYMTQVEFEEWLNATDDSEVKVAVAKVEPAKRGPSDARSLHELHILLKEMYADDSLVDYKFTEDEVAKFKAFFSKDTIHLTQKDVLMLAESISYIGHYSTDEMLIEMMTPLLNKYTFWADHPESVALADLEVWGKIPAKRLPQFIRATELIHSDEYIARYVTVLPMRCLNSLCDHVDHKLIALNVLDKDKNITSDLLLWVWKNRKKGGKDLLSIITIENVVSAISTINLPSAWLTAQRELKKLLLDNADFLKIIIENASTAASIVFALQACKALANGEQQSLLGKFSRHSDELKSIIEGGAGEQMLASTAKSEGVKEESSTEQPLITSLSSFNKRVAELDNIIKVQIPENKQAIATAREHGDLKENSEYKYAKQNQALLNSRRADLESEIANAQPTEFKNIEVDSQVVIGSTVQIELEDGSTETFYIVGAWDGDPEKGLVSYKTPVGGILYGSKLGDSIKLYDGRKGVIKSISVLPNEILETLDTK